LIDIAKMNKPVIFYYLFGATHEIIALVAPLAAF